MKILHLTHLYPPSVGGIQYLFQNLSEKLVTLFDDEVTVFTVNTLDGPSNPQARLIPAGEEIADGVKIRRFPFSQRGLPILKLAFRASQKARLPFRDYVHLLYKGPIAPEMFRETIRFEADVITAAPLQYLHILYPYMAKRLGKKTPLVYLGALHITDNYIHPSTLTIIRKADAYIALTAYERDILISKGISKEKIHILGVGIDPQPFVNANGQTVRDKFGINGSPVVAFVGRQAKGKGIDTLLNAMRSVWEKIPDARLLIAGARKNFSNQLDQMIAELSPQERDMVITIDSFSEEEKPDLFAACDVFVTASRIESFGIVYLEAWASGKPVIGSRIGAVKDVINEGQDGLLVPYGDVNQLASAILNLLNDEKLRTRLAQNGRAKVQTEYSWETITQKLRTVYERVQ